MSVPFAPSPGISGIFGRMESALTLRRGVGSLRKRTETIEVLRMNRENLNSPPQRELLRYLLGYWAEVEFQCILLYPVIKWKLFPRCAEQSTSQWHCSLGPVHTTPEIYENATTWPVIFGFAFEENPRREITSILRRHSWDPSRNLSSPSHCVTSPKTVRAGG